MSHDKKRKPDWVLTIPKETFEQIKTDPEFCALVTLARAVNALRFVESPILRSDNDDIPGTLRNRYNFLLFTCALFAEIAPLVEGMQKHFKDHRAFQKITAVTNSKEAHELRKGNLYLVRKKLVFHFDVKEVQRQMMDKQKRGGPLGSRDSRPRYRRSRVTQKSR